MEGTKETESYKVMREKEAKREDDRRIAWETLTKMAANIGSNAYYRELDLIVDSVLEMSAYVDYPTTLEDMLREEVDTSLTYWHQILLVINNTDNDEACWEDGEGVAQCSNSWETLTKMAFYSKYADAYSHLVKRLKDAETTTGECNEEIEDRFRSDD